MAAKILIVDDIPQNIQVLGAILRKHGYEIGYASDGFMALERIQASVFDLILLDVMMPGMSGYEVCKRIKENSSYQHVPIIFITARTDSDSLIKGFETGGVDYITKPFNEAELMARINTHLSLKESQDNLKKSQKQLSDANAAKDKLFSIIGHDLNNPLNIIQLGLENLMKNEVVVTSEKNQHLVGNMTKSIHRIVELLSNLIQWSRSQTGKMLNKATTIELYSTVYHAVNLLLPIAEKKQIQIDVQVDKAVFVYADGNVLMTVLRNLIGNALKFTPQGGKIIIRTESTKAETTIYVIDSGVGIALGDIPKLFNLQEHITTKGTEREHGTGLGLLICQEFVELMNGRIWVESVYGEGSSFIFTVPNPTLEVISQGVNSVSQ